MCCGEREVVCGFGLRVEVTSNKVVGRSALFKFFRLQIGSTIYIYIYIQNKADLIKLRIGLLSFTELRVGSNKSYWAA